MDKRELLSKTGSLQQLASIRTLSFTEGRAQTRAVELVNGPLRFTALADKCLDVAELSYRGVNFSFLSKPGLQGRNNYDTHGQEALRSIMGGLFFTAGLENICAPCTIEGKDYPMHGRIRTTPAEHLCADARWEGEEYVLEVRGEMREAELFGENLVLRRSLRTVFGQKSFTLTDEIENQSFRDEPLMLLYHINIGYPLLDEGTRLFVPTGKVTPREEFSAPHAARWNVMDAPKDNEPEYVFIHEPIPDEEGKMCACVVNDKLSLGLKISWNTENLPYFMEWKSVASGDYVLGLEPANSSVYGRLRHEERGDLHRLAPLAKERNELVFTVLDGQEEIDAALAAIRTAE
ncbi:MAG: aldose 1-epimerase family protein [Oscillospiraceae bacterium]|nr:aldose 1-epimerase family protein [Oscillospiraceae bacterium]